MRLAVSNIAWAREERLAAYDLLADCGIEGLEIAPGLFFAGADDPFVPDTDTAEAAVAEIAARGLSLVSMQSLLFGVVGAALLGNEGERAAFDRGMRRAIALAGRFGIPNLVFGSPAQRRIPPGMATAEAWRQAAETFRQLGDHAAANGTVIAMEPNAATYGTNFLTTLAEAEAFVAQVDHPAVALILDLGAMHMNGAFGSLADRLAQPMARLNHVHVSEANLAPAPDDATDLVPVLAALRAAGYGRAVSIEMKRPATDALQVLQGRILALTRACAAVERAA